MDEIWVPSRFNLDTFTRAGVQREKIFVIPHGFNPAFYRPTATNPLNIGRERGFNFLSIFEWTYRKGWDVLIRAYIEEFSPHEDVRLIIRAYQGGGVIGNNALPISHQLINFIHELGYSPECIPDIELIDQMIPAELMPSLYKMSDVFVLPTRGEGWGIPFTESMLMEVPVIATRWSGYLDYMNDENSYLIETDGLSPVGEEQIRDNPLYANQFWAEPSVESTRRQMRRAFENRDELRKRGKQARDHIISKFTIRHAALKICDRLKVLEGTKRRALKPSQKRGTLRVLYQARPDVFDLPGGDTELITRYTRIFEAAGLSIDFSADREADLRNYDLIHIFNIEPFFALNAAMQEKPFIVTPLYEDFSRYYEKSRAIVPLLKECLEKDDWKDFAKSLSALYPMKRQETAAPDFVFAVSYADAVIVSGQSEGYRIKRDFPGIGDIDAIRFGLNEAFNDVAVTDELFVSRYGLRDFVLCVGRLETRKNQLMLLYALKDDDIPVVFINSKTSQPDYEALCKKSRRRGETLFTGRVTREMLLSAYRAAKVHVLASWYELPGLVSLEAGSMGCNVVTTSWGTISEYLGQCAFYCEPDDPESIREAVLKAVNAPRSEALKGILREYSHDREADKVLKVYERVIEECRKERGRLKAKIRAAQEEVSYHRERGNAHRLLKADPRSAVDATSRLLAFRPDDLTSLFIRGAAYLSLMQYRDAECDLMRLLAISPSFDIKSRLYLALALHKQGKHVAAIETLERALGLHPFLPDETIALVNKYLAEYGQAMTRAGMTTCTSENAC